MASAGDLAALFGGNGGRFGVCAGKGNNRGRRRGDGIGGRVGGKFARENPGMCVIARSRDETPVDD